MPGGAGGGASSGPGLLSRLLPWLIAGGTSIGGAVIGARASGRATDRQAAAGERAAELQAETTREALGLTREQYNRMIQLQYPHLQLGAAALGPLGRGMGFAEPEGGYQLPTLKDLMIPGGPTDAPGGAPGGEGRELSLALDLAPKPPSHRRNALGGAAAGAGLGATVGSVVPGVGTAIGAGVGAVAGAASSLFGRGKKEANTIGPYQNALTEYIGGVQDWIKQQEAAGTLTPEAWNTAINWVTKARDDFYGMADQFGRAGPGARQTIGSWVDPMLEQWRGYAGGAATGLQTGGPAVGGGRYMVGEGGPEILEMAPGAEGWVYPNRTLKQVVHRQTGGPVTGALPFQQYQMQQRGIKPEDVLSFDPNTGQIQYRRADGAKVTTGLGGSAVARRPRSPDTPTIHLNAGDVSGAYNYFGNAKPGETSYGEWAGAQGITPEDSYGDYDRYKSGTLGSAIYRAGAGPSTGLRTSGEPNLRDQFGLVAKKLPKGAVGAQTPGAFPPGGQPWAMPGAPSYTQPRQPTGGTDNDAMIQQWGWQRDASGNWMNANGDKGYWRSDGMFVNQTTGQLFNPATGKLTPLGTGPGGVSNAPNPYRDMAAPYDTTEGEFMRPWQGEFEGNVSNRPFEFNTADLYEDPGYQFRLAEGEKAVERSAAARGMLQSGRTLKELTRWGQGLASDEFGRAYGRAMGENELAYGRDTDAYNRALNEYRTKYDIFEANQGKRFNRLQAISGGGQVAVNQLGQAGQEFARMTGQALQQGADGQNQINRQIAEALATGDIEKANAFIQMLASIGGDISRYLTIQQIMQGGTP